MKIVAIIPVKEENLHNVLDVINQLPVEIEPLVVWFERPSVVTNDSFIYGIEQKEKCGVGCAYREGFKVAIEKGYTHCLMYDSDGDMDASIIPEMLKHLNYDLIVASRWAKGGGFKGYNWVKLVFNYVGNFIFRFLLISPISDLTFGFKILSIDLLKNINLKSKGHDIYAETTMLPVAIGAKCMEIPVVWQGRSKGVASLSVFKAIKIYLKVGLRMLRYAYFR